LAASLLLSPAAVMAAPAPTAMTRQASTKALHTLLHDVWERMMADEPTWASSLGDRRYNDRWKDYSPNARAKRLAATQAELKRLRAIYRDFLSPADKLNYDLIERDLTLSLEPMAQLGDLMPVTHMGGIQTSHDIVSSLRFETVKDYEDWIARMRAFPRLMDQTLHLMEDGMLRGLMPPKAILARVPEQIKDQLPAKPEDSPFYKPFETMPAGWSADTQARLRAEAHEAIAQHILPAFRQFDRFFNDTYLPAAPEQVGLRKLPDGEKLYAYYARFYTTTELTPHRIHELGLSEVARIRKEMEGVMAEVGFKGTLPEFFASLKSDPRFFKSDATALLAEYRALAKRIDPKLVKLFKRMPRVPYGVEPVPEELAPNSSAAYYNGPAADGSRAGTFFVNLYKPEKRPTYEMTALTLHEAVPGHHFQIALAQEQGALPEFRKNGYYGAYIEGWGLYAESLGGELGLYDDPYVRFGRLNMEMRRALRLVLDTGLHHEGWSREQAIKFFLDNAAKTEMEATNEVDRYLAWPGQALSYKVGELKIRELRTRAEDELGPMFDVREFHDQVLKEGALPLDVLEQRIDAWIEWRKKH
jgi:uncharacterized protein (DUF885 family)